MGRKWKAFEMSFISLTAFQDLQFEMRSQAELKKPTSRKSLKINM